MQFMINAKNWELFIFTDLHVYIILTLLTKPSAVSEVKVSTHENDTWSSAGIYCSKTHGTILGGSSPGGYIQLKGILESVQWKYAWTDVQIKRFQALMWINGSSIKGRTFHKNDAKCGCIDLFDMEIYEYPCKQLQYYLCEFRSCTECPQGYAQEECVTFRESCYLISSSTATWYDARNMCKSQGGDLAVIDTNMLIDYSSHKIWIPFGKQALWLGVRTVDWFAKDRNVNRYHWLAGEPDPYNDCVILTRHNQHFGWKTYQCNKKANFVCQEPEISTFKNQEVPLSTKVLNDTRYLVPQQNNENGQEGMQGSRISGTITPISLTILILGAILIILAAAGYVMLVLKQRCNHEFSLKDKEKSMRQQILHSRKDTHKK